MTQAELTALINDKIRNKTPKVIKIEHADVDQAITDELFSRVGTLNTTISALNTTVSNQAKLIPIRRGYAILSGILPITSGILTSGGDVSSALGTSSGILITLTTPTANTNYKVRIDIEGLGGSGVINAVLAPTFTIVSTTQFYLEFIPFAAFTQNFKAHLEVISLD